MSQFVDTGVRWKCNNEVVELFYCSCNILWFYCHKSWQLVKDWGCLYSVVVGIMSQFVDTGVLPVLSLVLVLPNASLCSGESAVPPGPG